MRRAIDVALAGTWPTEQRLDTITLAFDDRHRRRLRLTADGGLDFLLDLADARVLRAGDGLALDVGGYVEVRPAAEDLVEVRATDPAALARVAWHLGNRHLPAQFDGERILIRDDHVIVAMLRGLGATTRPVRVPFEPEGGAYGQHNHDVRHPHGHAGDHQHEHDHGH